MRRLARPADDRGNAMVLVLASVMLITLLMGVMLSSIMFSIGQTTASRAHAQSQAAAEGGAQLVGRALLTKSNDATTACTGVSNLDPGGWTDYTVDAVRYQENAGDAWVDCLGGGSIPKLANAVQVKTTGHAKAIGQNGNERGNSATVEVTFTRPKSTGLDQAVFGDLDVLSNTNFNLYPDPDHPSRPHTDKSPDIVTNEKWTCPASGTLSGSVYALGGATVSTNCVIKGNFYVSGSLHIGLQLEVHGNLYIDGKLSGSKVIVHGDTLVNGNVELSAKGHSFGGNVRSYGKFTSSDNLPASFVGGTFYTKGAADTGWGSKETAKTLGSRFVPNYVVPVGDEDWLLPSILDNPMNPQTAQDKETMSFPMLKDDQEPWDTFTEVDWSTLTAGSLQGSRCNAYNYSQPLVISTPTKVDLTDCATWTVGHINIVLNADLVIFTKNAVKNGSWTVRTGNAPGDEKRHTLYIIALPDAGQTGCAAKKGKSITWSTNGWSQLDTDGKLRSKVVLYSSGKTTLSSKPSGTFNGQLYGCEVSAQSGIDMIFAKGGEDYTNTLWDLRLGAMRDITVP